MSDSYDLKLEVKHPDKIKILLKEFMENIVDQEGSSIWFKINDIEFQLTIVKNRVWIGVDWPQANDAKPILKQMYEKLKEEIIEATEWYGYKNPYQLILPYKTREDQWLE